jgi:hypothetical protein
MSAMMSNANAVSSASKSQVGVYHRPHNNGSSAFFVSKKNSLKSGDDTK